MAKAGSLKIFLSANSERLTREMLKARKSVKSFTKSSMKHLKKLKIQLFSMKSAFAVLAVGYASIRIGKTFIEAADTSEQLRIRLTALLGSVEKGNKLFKDMSKFASQVPFEFEEIMASATMLAGIMKGGVDEINEWMPLIGDLAAVSGLSIQKTTEQIVRMYSAGAASADLFRERGITAMLGFEIGVSYSAEETRKKLKESWNKQGSTFKGATGELAKTWTGAMSMMADKWFIFRNNIMEGGMFDYLKALVRVIDGKLNKSLKNTGELGKDVSETLIRTFKFAALAIGFFMDAARFIIIPFKAVMVALAAPVVGFITILDEMNKSIVYLLNLMPGLTIAPNLALSTWAEESRESIKSVLDEMTAMAESEFNMTKITKLFDEISAAVDKAASEKKVKPDSVDLVPSKIASTEYENAALIQLEIQQIEAMKKLREASWSDDLKLWNAGWQGKATIMSGAIGGIASLLETGNKKSQSIAKKFAIASIISDTAVAVMKAAANPWPFPALPLTIKAAALGGAQLAKVGGGGISAPSISTSTSSTSSSAPLQIDTPSQQSQVVFNITAFDTVSATEVILANRAAITNIVQAEYTANGQTGGPLG